MTWTKLSDDFGDQLERIGLTRGARLLHVEAYLYANRIGTDGRVERREVRKFSDSTDAELDELLGATWRDGRHLWEPIAGEADAWQLDWTDQEAAAVIADRQAKARDRQRRFRQRRDEMSHVTRDVTRDETQPRPAPPRPAPKRAGTGAKANRCHLPGHRGMAGMDADGDPMCDDCGNQPVRVVPRQEVAS